MKVLHAKDMEWPLKVDDFESYAIGPDQFLVGFYSSRPDYKGMIRSTSTQLRAASAALANAVFLSNEIPANIDPIKETAALQIQASTLSVAQHHDAITSSQRRHVHRDYIAQLSAGQTAVDSSVTRVVASSIAQGPLPVLTTCVYLNESACPSSEAPLSPDATVVVVLQNPTAHAMSNVSIRIPVSQSVLVWDGNRASVASQMMHPWPLAPFVHNETIHPPSAVVAFLASVPPLGTATYFLTLLETAKPFSSPPTAPLPPPVPTSRALAVAPTAWAGPKVLSNGILSASFDATGSLTSITRLDTNVTVALEHHLAYYVASNGSVGPHNPFGGSGSGNYIFQPDTASTHRYLPDAATIVSGPVVTEVRQTFKTSSVELVYRLYQEADILEVEYRVGPVDITDGLGKEVISRFDTDINSDDEWATDTNTLLMTARKRDNRATLWPGGPEYFNQTDPVAGNYFAANTQAWVADASHAIDGTGRRFSVLIDRSEGSSSLKPGSIELMLHRRLTEGCRWGMCEPDPDNGGKMESSGLNDTLGAEVVIRHWLSVDTQFQNGSTDAETRIRARQLNSAPTVMFAEGRTGAWPHAPQTWPLLAPLPPNVELTTWQRLDDGSALLRFTHIFAEGEHSGTLSKAVSIDLCAIFGTRLCERLATKGVGSFVEMNAAGDVPLSEVTRLSWNVHNDTAGRNESVPAIVMPAAGILPYTLHIQLNPEYTRTFKLSF